MNEIRNKDSYETLVYDFTRGVFVVCPNCEKKATVKSETLYGKEIKLICPDCGFNKTPELAYIGRSSSKKSTNSTKGTVVIGHGIDPYFHLPLWLSTNVGENLFWAYNYEHLNFIKEFVYAKLRERNINDMRNQSLGSRLPKWITSHKNREVILKTIEKLEKK